MPCLSPLPGGWYQVSDTHREVFIITLYQGHSHPRIHTMARSILECVAARPRCAQYIIRSPHLNYPHSSDSRGKKSLFLIDLSSKLRIKLYFYKTCQEFLSSGHHVKQRKQGLGCSEPSWCLTPGIVKKIWNNWLPSPRSPAAVVILFCLNSTFTNVVELFTVTWHRAFPQMVIKIFLNEIGTEFHLIGQTGPGFVYIVTRWHI